MQKVVGARQRTKATKLTSGQNHVAVQRYVAGAVYVGNGTLGSAGQVFLMPSGLTGTTVYAQSSGNVPMVPVCGSDSYVGQPYIADTMKHFARYRVLKLKLKLEALRGSTANDGVIAFAGIRGMGDPMSGATSNSSGAGGASLSQLESLNGSRKIDIWEDGEMDLMPFVAGGSAAKQNEFDISMVGVTGSIILQANKPYWKGAFPCCIAVGGSVNPATLNGIATHNVVIEMVS